METRGLSTEFIEEATERVVRLKAYSGILNTCMLDKISSGLDLLRVENIQTSHNPNSNVSAVKEKFESTIGKLRAKNEFLKDRIKNALHNLKKTNRVKHITDECRGYDLLFEEELEVASEGDKYSSYIEELGGVKLQIEVLKQEVNGAKRNMQLRESECYRSKFQSYDVQTRILKLEESLGRFRPGPQPKSTSKCTLM